MPSLRAGGQVREIDLIVFDKDGTLVDFDRLWAGKLWAGIKALLSAAGQTGAPDAALDTALCATLGIEPATMRVIPESPLAVATLPKLALAAAVVLHQHGYPWHAAETLAREVFLPVIQEPPRVRDIQPIGDVAGLLSRLRADGFRVAIFTSDDRHATEVSLPMLGIESLVEAMVCGDDPIPGKPAGDGLLHLARHFGVAPSRIAMIGDSVTDMRAAQGAGVGWRIAVRSGTGEASALTAAADVLIDNVEGIKTV